MPRFNITQRLGIHLQQRWCVSQITNRWDMFQRTWIFLWDFSEICRRSRLGVGDLGEKWWWNSWELTVGVFYDRKIWRIQRDSRGDSWKEDRRRLQPGWFLLVIYGDGMRNGQWIIWWDVYIGDRDSWCAMGWFEGENGLDIVVISMTSGMSFFPGFQRFGRRNGAAWRGGNYWFFGNPQAIWWWKQWKQHDLPVKMFRPPIFMFEHRLRRKRRIPFHQFCDLNNKASQTNQQWKTDNSYGCLLCQLTSTWQCQEMPHP